MADAENNNIPIKVNIGFMVSLVNFHAKLGIFV